MSVEISPVPTVSPDPDVPALLVYQVRSRAYTQAGREFYDPAFGFEAYRPDQHLRRRQDVSLSAIPGWDYARQSFVVLDRLIKTDVLLEPTP